MIEGCGCVFNFDKFLKQPEKVSQFNSLDSFRDYRGNKIDSNAPWRYQVTGKTVLRYPIWLRGLRILSGSILVISSLGLAILSKQVRHLFTKEAKVYHYGKLIPESDPDYEKKQRIEAEIKQFQVKIELLSEQNSY